MKIWYGFGSEHSMNLVMIGHFKSSAQAKKVLQQIQELSANLRDKIDVGKSLTRFNDDIRELLRKANCHNLGPSELEQLLYDASIKVEGKRIVLTTEEFEISAFLKLMIEGGARVETYSAHDYPETDSGRGK